jgi:hypothetical protein
MVKVRIWDDGVTVWYLNGLCHRDNGPSVVWPDGILQWYYRDLLVTEYEHMMLMAQEQISG